MKKKILLLAFVVLLTQVAVADDHVEFPDMTVDYNSEPDIEILCDSSGEGECPTSNAEAEIEVCGSTHGVDVIGDGDPYTYLTNTVNFPADAPCRIGDNYYAFELKDNGNVVQRGGEIELDVATETDNLLVRINANGFIYGSGDKDGRLSDFRLTNDENADQGEIVVSEWDKGGDHDRTPKTAKLNFVLDRDTRFLNSFLANPYPIDCPSSHSSYEEDDNDNCQVATTEFTNDWSKVGVSKCSDGIGCRSGYFGGTVYYETNGEIVVGQKYEEGGPPEDLTETKFHLCHSAVDSTHGNAVYSPESNSQYSEYSHDQFRCNSQGEWENVALCEDGIDNNENGATDLDDALCDYSWQNSEIEPEPCEKPRVGRLAASYEDPDTGETYDEGTKVAFHSYGDDFVDDTSDCGYADFDPEVPYSGEPPELFRCTSSGGYSSYSSTDSQDNGNAVTSDAYLTYLCDELSEVISTETWNAHSGSMPMAEYFIAKEDIPIGFNKYATSGGFQNKFYESLHSAEEENYESVEVRCNNEPNFERTTLEGRTGVECFTTEHNNDSYEPISLMDLGDGYESGEYLDSWIIANATGNHTDKIYKPSYGEVDRDNVFNGGFAGKCETGTKWRYNEQESKWWCSGQLSFQHQYVVPDLPPGSNGDETVGVFIRNKTFNTGSTIQNLESVWFRENSEGLDVNYIDVMCFAGTSTEDLSSDEKFTKKLELPDEVNQPFFKVTGSVNMSSSESYTCKWKFEGTTENGDEKIFDEAGMTPQPVSEEKLVDLGVDEGSYASPEDLDSVSETSTTEVESSY